MHLFGDPITNLMEDIIKSATKTKYLLDKNEIEKANKEIKKIVELDIENIRDIEKKIGDQNVLREAYIILNDAKQILDSYEFGPGCLTNKHKQYFDEKIKNEIISSIKLLLNKIIEIEKHEIKEINEDKQKVKIIKKKWIEEIEKQVIYHGTNSAALKKIKKYGLVPGMKIYDTKELDILIKLIRRAGNSSPIGPWFESQDKVVYYTVDKDASIDYAQRSPEFWQQLTTPNFAHYKSSKNYEEAFRTISSKLCGQNNRLEKVSKNDLIKYVHENSKLDKKEINLAYKIFYRLWEVFGDEKPVVLHISVKAPFLNKVYSADSFENFMSSFSIYLHFYQKFPDNKFNFLLIPENRIQEKIENFFYDRVSKAFHTDSTIKVRIPSKFIIKYEYV